MKIIDNLEVYRLLYLVDKFGSMNQAAKEIGITYKTAWKWMYRLKAELGYDYFYTEIGGHNRGGTYLNQEGKNLIKNFIES